MYKLYLKILIKAYYQLNYKKFSFISNKRNYINFADINVNAKYLDLVNNKAKINCILKCQLIQSPFNIKVNIKIDFLFFKFII